MGKVKNLIVDDISFYNDFMRIYWSANIGWGEMDVKVVDTDYRVFEIDTETLGREFVEQALIAAKDYIIAHMVTDVD